MNRLIVSAIGVILTFFWIIYTAPTRPDKPEKLKNEPIKKIIKSGSSSHKMIRQAIDERIEPDNLEDVRFNAVFYHHYTSID